MNKIGPVIRGILPSLVNYFDRTEKLYANHVLATVLAVGDREKIFLNALKK